MHLHDIRVNATMNGSQRGKRPTCEERQGMQENGHKNERSGSDLHWQSGPRYQSGEERHTLNKRGGTIGERGVKISLTVAMINSTMPTTRGAIVCAVDPGKVFITKRVIQYKWVHTAVLAEVEAN